MRWSDGASGKRGALPWKYTYPDDVANVHLNICLRTFQNALLTEIWLRNSFIISLASSSTIIDKPTLLEGEKKHETALLCVRPLVFLTGDSGEMLPQPCPLTLCLAEDARG